MPDSPFPRIWLSPPHLSGTELELVKKALESNWVAPAGPQLDAFEQDVESYTGRPVVALNSGTAAVHLALQISGVQRGDEVICQSLTFSGSAFPILYTGAVPVFVDSEPDTWNISPALLEEVISDRIRKKGKVPKAIIYVHLYGMPAKIREINEIARRYNMVQIEDAAEAFGASYWGRPAGSLGDIGVFSFNGNKIVTTSGGGALCAEKVLTDKARFLATQAKDSAPHYEHSSVGYNYRMSNICAAIGRGQLQVLPERIKRRRAIFDYYSTKLNLPGITFLSEPHGHFSNRWLSTILINSKEAGFSREDIRLALAAVNIESRPVWKPMHMQPLFRGAPSYTNGVSDSVFENGLCLPSGTQMTDLDLERICSIITSLRK